jgi:hypothetical protein
MTWADTVLQKNMRGPHKTQWQAVCSPLVENPWLIPQRLVVMYTQAFTQHTTFNTKYDKLVCNEIPWDIKTLKFFPFKVSFYLTQAQ